MLFRKAFEVFFHFLRNYYKTLSENSFEILEVSPELFIYNPKRLKTVVIVLKCKCLGLKFKVS